MPISGGTATAGARVNRAQELTQHAAACPTPGVRGGQNPRAATRSDPGRKPGSLCAPVTPTAPTVAGGGESARADGVTRRDTPGGQFVIHGETGKAESHGR